MTQQTKQIWLSLLIIGAVLFMLWAFTSAVVSSIAQLQSAVAGSILAASIAAIAAFSVNVYVKQKEARLRSEQEIQAKLVPLYEEFIDTIFSSFKAQMLGEQPLSQDELKKQLIELIPRIITWGSDDLINQWNKIRETDFTNKSAPLDILGPWDELLVIIRKDLGHSNKRLEKYALMRLYTTDWRKGMAEQGAAANP